MNSELEKLIEKYRITVNGLADLESDYEKVIKERGFVTLNGLLVESNEPAGEGTENAVNTENTPVAESDTSHNEPTPVVPAPSDNSAENTPVAPAPVENPGVTPVTEGPVSNDTNLGSETAAGAETAPVENPGVTPVPSEPAVSDSTNLGTEVAASSTDGTAADAEETSEDDPASTEDSTAGRKPKKKKN